MLSLFLFSNLFLHVIYFSYYKIEATTYVYRLTIVSLLCCIANDIHNIILLTSDYSMTLFNDSLRLNTTIFTQEAFLALIAIILLIGYRDFKFKQEFYLFVFGHLVSANFLLESYNFIMLFISWEFFNLSLYIMIVSNGIKKQQALSASLKYFLLSAFSTAFLLLALTMIYHITGSLEFEPVYLAMQNTSIDLPIILIIFALIFKLGAAPLHFWAPDLYDSVPLPVTAFISTLPKIVYLFLITNLADFLYGQFNFFMIAGFLSLIVGAIGLSQQYKIKRFFAFSSITNIGYLLIVINDPQVLAFNLVIYILTAINIFIILIYIQSLYERDIDHLELIKGLFYKNPFLALVMALSLFSLAAIPPLPGFFAKYQLLIFTFNYYSPVLFGIIIITSVIAVANYIRLIYLIFYNPKVDLYAKSIDNNKILSIILILNSTLILFITFSKHLPTLIYIY